MQWKLFLALGLLTAAACGDDASGASQADAGPAGDGDGDGDGDAGSEGLAPLGPTSKLRVANTVDGVSFDAWTADTKGHPRRVAQNLTFGTISDYFEVTVNPISQDPEFLLLRTGEQPATNWQAVSGPDRAFITVSQLDGANQRGSVIVSSDDDTDQLQTETLDESDLETGDPSQANLHIHYGLFDIVGVQAIDFGIAGQGCFHTGSTSVSEVFSLPPGVLDFGVYESKPSAGCQSSLLWSAPLEVAAGDNVLVVTYLSLENSTVQIVSAPIELP